MRDLGLHEPTDAPTDFKRDVTCGAGKVTRKFVSDE